MSEAVTLQNTSNAISLQVSEGSPLHSNEQEFQQASMFGQEASLARTSVLPESARAWLEADPDSTSNSSDLLQNVYRSMLSLRTSPDFLTPMRDETLRSLSEGLPESYLTFLRKAGEQQGSSGDWFTRLPIGFSMRNISDWHSAAAVCSLSQVLEADVAPKYFLSAKACQGILRRAEKRGKELPPMLLQALRQVAGELSEPEKAADKTR